MLASPATVALIACSCMVGGFTLYAAGVGMRIMLQWDIDSASEKQLLLERKTYLVSSILGHVLIIELASLFLFIAAANTMHSYFTGAMCAAGVLNVNAFGNLALLLRTASFFCCGVWLVVNHVDSRAVDFPLIRFKYTFLLIIGLLLMAEGVLQFLFLLGLDPQIITSCCGAIFGEGARGVAAEMAHLSPSAAAGSFYFGMAATLAVGMYFLLTGRHDWIYGILSTLMLPLSVAALVSYFCLYIYEHPTHHCPFCLLQEDYHFIGYCLYSFLLLGAVAGASIGVIGRFRRTLSLAVLIPRIQQRLCRASLLGYGLFTVAVSYATIFTDFRLTGY